MAGFFYNLGKKIGPKLRQANWVLRSLTGSEKEAIEAEGLVGRDLAQQFVAQSELDGDPKVHQVLQEVGGRLGECLKEPKRQFWFGPIRGGEVNAFALPGGYIFITRPLLEFCHWNKDEIAFVLGHEMAHVILRHAIERLMASSLIRTGISRLPVGGMFGAPIVNLAATLLNQGYSQDNELEADRLGVRLAHCAGHDPRAAVQLLSRLRTIPAEASMLSSYLSSHPPVDLRVRRIEQVAAALSG